MTPALDHLVTVDDNPLPEGAVVSVIATVDAVTLRVASWMPETATTGTVIILPGRSEYIERYFETVGALRARGFAVAALDWRGQGGSARELADPRKGHIDDFLLYLRDLDALLTHLDAIGAPRPWYGLAHSMGGAILTLAVARGEQRLARAVATAPMIGIFGARLGGSGHHLARALNLIGLGGRYVPVAGPQTATIFAPFAGNVLTSDQTRYERSASILIAGPDLALGAPTISWVAAAFRLFRDMADPMFGLTARCPLLYVLAGADQVVDTAAAEALAARIRGAASVTIAGARHEILMERDAFRDEFWAAFDAFIPAAASLPSHEAGGSPPQ